MAISLGIKSMMFSKLAPDGGVGTDWKSYGDTLEGTFDWTTEDGTPFEVRVEEKTSAIFTRTTAGNSILSWEIPNAKLEDWAELLDGDYDLASKTFSAKSISREQELSVKMETMTGNVFTFTRVNVVAKVGNGAFGRENTINISISGTLLDPTKADAPLYTNKEL